MLWDQFSRPADSAQIAREIYRAGASELAAAFRRHSTNARRLLANPDLRDDVSFALQRDTVPFIAELKSGAVVKVH